MESSVVTHLARWSCLLCRTGPWSVSLCTVVLQNANDMDGLRSWLGWPAVVDLLVSVNVDRD